MSVYCALSGLPAFNILLIIKSGEKSTCYLKDTDLCPLREEHFLHVMSCFLRCYSWGHLSTSRQRQHGRDRLVLYSNHIDQSLGTQIDYIFYLALQFNVAFKAFWPIECGWCKSLPGNLKPDTENPSVDWMPRRCQSHIEYGVFVPKYLYRQETCPTPSVL